MPSETLSGPKPRGRTVPGRQNFHQQHAIALPIASILPIESDLCVGFIPIPLTSPTPLSWFKQSSPFDYGAADLSLAGYLGQWLV
jgi:hypothetical protein